MSSLLEIKRSGCLWEKIIFPTDSLTLDHLSNEQAFDLLRIISREMSDYYPGDIFMPHEIANVAIGSMNIDDFNSYELELSKSLVYDIVVDFSDIIFETLKNYATVEIGHLDNDSIVVNYQISPKENF